MLVRTRPIAIIAALTLIVLSLGMGSAASADPGNSSETGVENAAHSEKHQTVESTTPPGDPVAVPMTDSASVSEVNGKSAEAPGHNKSDSASDQAASHVTSGTAGTSGAVKSPQPNSRADDNPGGANGQCPGGPYCSTRDGSPSLNGNGNGKAVGKPCAGCVGKADNKNPKGQRPSGSDHNAGYECDRNHGIGRTNPAHTGCKAVVPPPPPPPPVCVPSPANNNCGNPPPPVCVPSPANNNCGTPPAPVDRPNPPVDRPNPPVDRPNPPVDRPRPPAVIGGVETVAPPAVLPSAGAPAMMGWTGAGGAVLVMVGGLTIWMQRRPKPIG